ncbi:helix-turn-helix domain-containing protein [Clostridium botulinum]|uniref:helix-turn-helix domain-containing protein n=1 Tax=Clostridium botulinum TaxID=1491 RepID=UPI00057F4EA8|nr:helix-turn-helix transcriptional regulator [Clostridium botulinum]
MNKGLRLKQLRKELNLTQLEFAKKLNMTRSNIGNIETGVINLSDRNIREICNVFNVNEEWLRHGNGEMFEVMEENAELLQFIGKVVAEKDEFIRKTFLTLAKLEPYDWEVVKKIIKSLQTD